MKYVFWYSDGRFVKSVKDNTIEIGSKEEALLFTKEEADDLLEELFVDKEKYNIEWCDLVLLGDYALDKKEFEVIYKTKYILDDNIVGLQKKIEEFLNSKECLEVVAVSHEVLCGNNVSISCLVTYKGYK